MARRKQSPSGRNWYPLGNNSSHMNKNAEESADTTKEIIRRTNNSKYSGGIVSPNKKDNFLF